ncbi:MAG: pyridoxal 5'-phosphate synthase glutaminase subunit PdxT [Chloroflexi bacterium]|nr:pyridoxal 5'-phosphate synthase glutaminase subunit PdxT [Chloroflexota bacterium]
METPWPASTSGPCPKRRSWRPEGGNLPRVGVLAIQGDFLEHRQVLERIGVDAPEIRLPHQLDDVDGLIIPGGESTTIVQLIDIYGFRKTLKAKSKAGMPIWGTCAGMIVIASSLSDRRPEPLGLMNIRVSRNAFGRQFDSFEQDLTVEELEGPPFHGVFIRAPAVKKIGDGVRVMASLDDGRPVAVRQDRLFATAFHPELTDDTRIHEMFVRIVEGAN